MPLQNSEQSADSPEAPPMVIKRSPKIILEGTRLTGKTDLAFALNEHPRIVGVRKYRYHSPIISAEWNGFTRSPYGASLINFTPSYEELAMDAYRTWAKLFELYRYYSWIVDRFHISTQAWQSIYAKRHYDFAWLEKRLVPLGFRLVFCWRRPDSFEKARQRRLAISSNPSQYEDLEIFLREQEVVQELFDRSLLPKMVVDVTDKNLDHMVTDVADWLEATGGLTVPDMEPSIAEENLWTHGAGPQSNGCNP
jgi:thymidylate kinase